MKFTPGMIIAAFIFTVLFTFGIYEEWILLTLLALSLVIDAILKLRPARSLKLETEKRYYKEKKHG